MMAAYIQTASTCQISCFNVEWVGVHCEKLQKKLVFEGFCGAKRPIFKSEKSFLTTATHIQWHLLAKFQVFAPSG